MCFKNWKKFEASMGKNAQVFLAKIRVFTNFKNSYKREIQVYQILSHRFVE